MRVFILVFSFLLCFVNYYFAVSNINDNQLLSVLNFFAGTYILCSAVIAVASRD